MIDLFSQPSATDLANKGMKRAVDNANRMHDDWDHYAYEFFKTYILDKDEVMTEDVRNASKNIVPQPPNARAWGTIAQRAVKAGLIKRVGYRKTKNPNSHGTPATLWGVIKK